MLQCISVCCSVLQRVAVRRSVLLDDTRDVYDEALVLGDVAVCCNVLQCVAVCCSVLQGVAGHCSV